MDDSKLIELVREHPSIFNPKHHHYKDIDIRENVWKEVAGSLKQPVEECKNRRKNIRDTFMRGKRNKILSTRSARSKKLRKWHLEFLKQIEYGRETLTNTAALETNDDSFDYETQITEVEEMERNPPDEEHDTVVETLTETNISETPAKQGEKEVQSALKRKHPTKISGDNIVELLKKNSEDRVKLLSTVLAKQKEEHPINVFFLKHGNVCQKTVSSKSDKCKNANMSHCWST